MLLFIIIRSSLFVYLIYVSIHLMLLFILNHKGFCTPLPSFQYISCYSLSSSNTRLCRAVQLFQYISCYSLSKPWAIMTMSFHVSIHLMLLFIQYLLDGMVMDSSFNTSHVTLYLQGAARQGYINYRFNTSHVTLYPVLGRIWCFWNTFQYISCYSLSWKPVTDVYA
mgnify:CR=1 FL=1